MRKVLLLITILSMSACANENYTNAPILYGPNPDQYDTFNEGYRYDMDEPVNEDGLGELSPFDHDAARVSRELEEIQEEKDRRVYKKLVPNSYDDAFHN